MEYLKYFSPGHSVYPEKNRSFSCLRALTQGTSTLKAGQKKEVQYVNFPESAFFTSVLYLFLTPLQE